MVKASCSQSSSTKESRPSFLTQLLDWWRGFQIEVKEDVEVDTDVVVSDKEDSVPDLVVGSGGGEDTEGEDHPFDREDEQVTWENLEHRVFNRCWSPVYSSADEDEEFFEDRRRELTRRVVENNGYYTF